MEQWTDRSWLAEANAWIDEQDKRSGSRIVGTTEQPHVREWSTVLRVPTTDGNLWFKANIPRLTYEAHVVELLARERPADTPGLIAIHPDHGWILARDGGDRLREVLAREGTLRRWLEVLPRYAELQLATAPQADELVSLGVPDRRLRHLCRQYETLLDQPLGLDADEVRRLRRLVPWVRDASESLAALGIPETIQHDDLHDGQVFCGTGRYLFADWNDACVAHPFLSMAVTLEGQIAWGMDDVENSEDLTAYRDAYLEPFTGMASRAELNNALDSALRLGWICRALTYASALEPRDVDADDGAPRVRLQMFLAGLP